MKKSLLLNLNLLLCSILSSCSSLKDIDKPVCVELNISKAFCTTIISGKESFVDDVNLMDGKTWFEIRPTMIQVPVETWGSLKTYLIVNCKRSKKCEENIDSWTRSIHTIDEEIIKKSSSPDVQPFPQ